MQYNELNKQLESHCTALQSSEQQPEKTGVQKTGRYGTEVTC